MNGLNSSSSPSALNPAIKPLIPPALFGVDAPPGRPGAPSSTSSAAKSAAAEGSNRGCKNARNRFKM
jgi:hypothetical protein